MAPDDEPPGWALPIWDAAELTKPASPGPDAAQGPRTLPGEHIRPSGPATPSAASPLVILGVSDVTRVIRDAIRAEDRLRDVWIEGEVGRVTISTAGHAYFTLKDERSQLPCVWFRDERLGSPFEARTGLRVVVRGRVDVFDAQGVYQLYVSVLQPAGFGDLAIRFEALKARLAAEGLFEPARKRPLPTRPAVIAVATSETGAVWHDICHVLERRWPIVRVVLAPCQVQGEPAAASIVAALHRIDRYGERCRQEGHPDDAPAVTIVARGGGSPEDLWSFNDERVVRAIAAHSIPVVAGVGHETDVTLTDFVADRRAPTPSAAAEVVVPDRDELVRGLAGQARQLRGLADRRIAAATRDLVGERRALARLHPEARLAAARERAGLQLDRATRAVLEQLGRRKRTVAATSSRLDPAAAHLLQVLRGALDGQAATLAALGPQATLERGYAIARRRSDGRILRDPAEAPAGMPLILRLARGDLSATAEPRDPEP